MATPDTIPRAVTPQVDTAPAGWVWHSLAALTVVLFGVTLYLIFMEAPVEEQMGELGGVAEHVGMDGGDVVEAEVEVEHLHVPPHCLQSSEERS